jgi:hypothetical protein
MLVHLTAEHYREGLRVLVTGLPETIAERLIGALEQIELCEGGIPIQNWCPMCMGKMLLIMRIIRVEREKMGTKIAKKRRGADL